MPALPTLPTRDELRALLTLAVPVVVVQVGMMMMGVVDTIMVGHLNAEALASVALGNLYWMQNDLLRAEQAFKIESHNHPSAVEPFQGAATGVGGILRDIFTMGARPIASLDSLRFGAIALSTS